MTSQFSPPANSQTDAQRTATIRKGILAAGDTLRARHPWLRYQNAIGLSIFLASIAGILACAWGYAAGVLPVWATVPLCAILMSFLHELEHDLIHYMYFRKQPFWHNLMMAGVWLFRPSTASPWTRRRVHLHHHKSSGTDSDLEERGITNGEPWGLRRLLMLGDNMLAVYLRPFQTQQMVRKFIKAQKPASQAEVRALVRENLLTYFPLGNLYYLLWHGFIAYHASVWLAQHVFGVTVTLPATAQPVLSVVNFLVVVLMLPNVLRTFCLHFVSSNMHYYGDVEPGNIVQQTQVWTAWWLAPLHLFCFNFGSTHASHHFVVRDPFYIRQAISRHSHAVMRAHGVRFNDFGTFRRANRYHPTNGIFATEADLH